MKASDTHIELSRDELYEQIWSTPARKLAREYGISDVGLAKICKRYQIPKPPVGYWARRTHGHKVKKTVLPKAKGIGQRIIIRRHLHEDEEKLEPAIQESLVATRRETAITVAALPDAPHPLVAKTLKSLKSAKPDEQGLCSPRASGCLDVAVTHEQAQRAMEILHALITELKRLGYPVAIKDDRSVVTIHGETLGFSLTEVSKREERPPTPKEKAEMEKWLWFRERRYYVYKPTGRLCLRIRCGLRTTTRRSWSDGKHQRVEKMLSKFITTALILADGIKKDRAEREEKRRKREAWEKERYARLAEIEAEEKKLKRLHDGAAVWHEAQQLRLFIAAIEEMAAKDQALIVDDQPAADFIAWARVQADRIDPLVTSPPSILDEKEKWAGYRYW